MDALEAVIVSAGVNSADKVKVPRSCRINFEKSDRVDSAAGWLNYEKA